MPLHIYTLCSTHTSSAVGAAPLYSQIPKCQVTPSIWGCPGSPVAQLCPLESSGTVVTPCVPWEPGDPAVSFCVPWELSDPGTKFKSGSRGKETPKAAAQGSAWLRSRTKLRAEHSGCSGAAQPWGHPEEVTATARVTTAASQSLGPALSSLCGAQTYTGTAIHGGKHPGTAWPPSPPLLSPIPSEHGTLSHLRVLRLSPLCPLVQSVTVPEPSLPSVPDSSEPSQSYLCSIRAFIKPSLLHQGLPKAIPDPSGPSQSHPCP